MDYPHNVVAGLGIWDAQWRNLANTIEPSMCGGDATFLPIKLLRPLVV